MGSRIRATFLSRLQSVSGTTMVLDVSHMDSDGTGARTITKPNLGSRKFGVPGLNIVSDNENG